MNIQIRPLVAVFLLSTAVPAHAQTRPVDLSSATLEDLMNIEITSASRKEERANEVPAAVFVMTHDDIRRSGMTSLPDLLRLVPGVQVAQINSNKWAVSIRGFNGLYSNKLLVLVDGRSIYNPLFGGVQWDTEDLMLEDVDRIEVIRGSGAAVWGSNAVNGVINILTRPAADTRGLLVRVGTGTLDSSNLAVRYGGTAGSIGAYRAYAQLSTHGDSRISPQVAANDHWRSFTSGIRGDWFTGSEAFMFEGSIAAGQERPLWLNLDPAASGQNDSSGVSQTQVGSVLGRWTHGRSGGATLQVQSYVDFAHRREPIGEYHRRTMDLDTVYHTVLGRRHDLVVGGGFRYISEAIDDGVGYAFVPNRPKETLVNAFAQDEISLAGRRVQLTLGAKLERESDDGSNVQPTARVMWNVNPRQHLWAAVSHALRTPSLVDKGIHVTFPPTVQAGSPDAPPVAISVLGNPEALNERLISTEAGYRLDIGSRAAIDVAGFIGRYRGLLTAEPSAPSLTFVGGRPVVSISTVFQNLLAADTRGTEITALLKLTSAWRVDGSFSAFHLTPHLDPASHDPIALIADGDAPAYQWRGHSALSLGLRAQADVLLFHVGSLGRVGIPAYTRADARFEWKLTPELSAAFQGQNLFSPAHVEFGGNKTTIVTTQVPRNGSLRLTWQF
jgi:iron complex outermembrane recepter protein